MPRVPIALAIGYVAGVLNSAPSMPSAALHATSETGVVEFMRKRFGLDRLPEAVARAVSRLFEG
jgi:hypothetical protein